MKKYLLFALFVLCGSSNIFAQKAFLKQLPVNDSILATKIYDVLVDQDTIVFYGVYQDIDNYYGIFFSKMDSLGNVLVFNKIKDSLENLTSSRYGKLIKTYDGYAMYGSSNKLKLDSSGYYQETYIIQVNHKLELDFYHFYPYPNFESMINYSILEAENGFYLFGTQQLPLENDHNWFVIRTDAQGNLLWKKSYFKPNTRDFGSEMLRLDANTIVLFGTTTDDLPPGVGGDHFGYPRMLAIDTLGNEKWDWNWNGDILPNESATSLMATPDGGFLYGSSETVFGTNGEPYTKLMIVKLDSNLTEEWRRLIDTIEGHLFNDAHMINLALSQDGNYIVSGGLWYYIYHGEFSPEGDRLWARYDSTWVGDYTSYDRGKAEGTAILSSGSIISGGEFKKQTDAGWWTIWSFIMKLTPDGCLDTLACWPVALEKSIQTTDYQLSAYPNPASDVVHFSLSQDVLMPKKSEIVITDILGRKVDEIRYVSRDVRLDVRNYPQGLYFYRLEVGGRVLDVGKILVEKL